MAKYLHLKKCNNILMVQQKLNYNFAEWICINSRDCAEMAYNSSYFRNS